MKRFIILFLLCAIILSVSAPFMLDAQGIRDNSPQSSSSSAAGSQITRETALAVPLKKVVILTSGLAYYEHSGQLSGSVSFNLPFRLDSVNDALKTLVINDPASANPSVSYQSENTLIQTLRSLSIDISDSPDLAVILSRLRGAEVEIASYTGRITGIEYRSVMFNFQMITEPWLLLSTPGGMMSFNLKEISSVKFTDPVIERDLNRALDLIASSRNSFSRLLSVNLPGSGRRDVSISYVIPSPVWKVSYRLDLGASKPLFQGWAIIDNDSDTDWKNIELSLVAGRPTSFIQALYPPYYVARPVLPLSIAGTAEAAVHERGVLPAAAPSVMMDQSRAKMSVQYEYAVEESLAASPSNLAGGTVQTAAGSEAGGQFEFTIKNPVNLDRRMSAMFPLVESEISANGVLIYNGSGKYPRLGAEITNTSGMKLPAGPITVYDGGVYAGDALIEFWNENEKRLISFGEDLSITADASGTSTRTVRSVSIADGVMTINRNLTFVRTYTFLNSGNSSKQLIVEHSKTAKRSLFLPARMSKRQRHTVSMFRYAQTGKQL